jgi:hypothetical protein
VGARGVFGWGEPSSIGRWNLPSCVLWAEMPAFAGMTGGRDVAQRPAIIGGAYGPPPNLDGEDLDFRISSARCRSCA